jgi:hypothetical protein
MNVRVEAVVDSVGVSVLPRHRFLHVELTEFASLGYFKVRVLTNYSPGSIGCPIERSEPNRALLTNLDGIDNVRRSKMKGRIRGRHELCHDTKHQYK